MKLSGIKACVFDAYGTLFDVHSAIGKHKERLGDKAQAVSMTWRDKQLQYTWLRSLMKAHTDFWQVTQDGLDFALEQQGISDASLRDDLMQAYLELDPYPEVIPTLTRLKQQGFQTAILSNGAPKMLSDAVSHAKLDELIDKQLSVESVGIYKPDAKVYQLACDSLDVTPAEVCFLSSNAWDVAGSSHFGFQVLWINRFNQPQDRLPGQEKAIIKSLDEMLDKFT